MTEDFLFKKIITHWPKYIIDEYGQGVITPAYYYHRGANKYFELRSNRRNFVRNRSKYTNAFDDLVSGEFGIEFKSLAKEVIIIIDIIEWNKICDKLQLSENHPLRDCYYLSFDYVSISSGVIIEIDGEQHEKNANQKLKDEIQDIYTKKVLGLETYRLFTFGYIITKFDEKGKGTDWIGDPEYLNKFNSLKKFLQERISDIGYSHLFDQKKLIIESFKGDDEKDHNIYWKIIEKIESRSSIEIYTSKYKSVTIFKKDYSELFSKIKESDLGEKAICRMFQNFFNKKLIIK